MTGAACQEKLGETALARAAATVDRSQADATVHGNSRAATTDLAFPKEPRPRAEQDTPLVCVRPALSDLQTNAFRPSPPEIRSTEQIAPLSAAKELWEASPIHTETSAAAAFNFAQGIGSKGLSI